MVINTMANSKTTKETARTAHTSTSAVKSGTKEATTTTRNMAKVRLITMQAPFFTRREMSSQACSGMDF